MKSKYKDLWYLVESYDDRFIALFDFDSFTQWMSVESAKHYKLRNNTKREVYDYSALCKFLSKAIENNTCTLQTGYIERWNHAITIYSENQLTDKVYYKITNRVFDLVNELAEENDEYKRKHNQSIKQED